MRTSESSSVGRFVVNCERGICLEWKILKKWCLKIFSEYWNDRKNKIICGSQKSNIEKHLKEDFHCTFLNKKIIRIFILFKASFNVLYNKKRLVLKDAFKNVKGYWNEIKTPFMVVLYFFSKLKQF